jgi:hypothetical protein
MFRALVSRLNSNRFFLVCPDIPKSASGSASARQPLDTKTQTKILGIKSPHSDAHLPSLREEGHLFHRSLIRVLLIATCLLPGVTAIFASESDAIDISKNIQQFHLPYRTILDPVFASADPASPGFSTITGYARAGDSATWTGHYLAAEAFRYKATRSPEALANAWVALRGIRSLIDITGNGVLARCLVPADSPYGATIQREEGGHGIYSSVLGTSSYFWIGNTSRDQYSGVMFGLSAAYDMIDDTTMRDFIRSDVTRILNYLLRRGWNVVMPDGKISTTFLHRPDQQLSFLQVGRRINPEEFDWTYRLYRTFYAAFVITPIQYDNFDDHNHYFKFNINYINLYNLLRLEDGGSPAKGIYMSAYNELRRTTENHGNAFFNMLDRAIRGGNTGHDLETTTLLDLWLKRPRRDVWVDLRGPQPACGNDRACVPIQVDNRVNTDFLWQRSPFLLYGGGSGQIETAGIDYILPYWMSRAYGAANKR